MKPRQLERKLLWSVVGMFVIPTALAEGMTKFLIWDAAKLAIAAGIFPLSWWLIGRRPDDR